MYISCADAPTLVGTVHMYMYDNYFEFISQLASLEFKVQSSPPPLTYIQELEVCRSEASAKAEEVKTVKRENRKRRKIIEAYQDMLSQGATGLHPVRQWLAICT